MTDKSDRKLIIIGGGLAGLTAAIHILKSGFAVTLIEKSIYPQHKVCGEYISNEVKPYLDWLELDISSLRPSSISRFELTAESGKSVCADLPIGGFGISRFSLDHFLLEQAKLHGAEIITDTVNQVDFNNNQFQVHTATSGTLTAELVIGAYGKRSVIDQKLQRPFIQKKSPWLAVKAHYEAEFEDDLVALHNFKGGYCGVSKVEKDRVNICYLTDYAHFKTHKNLQDFQQQVLFKNPHLKQIFERSSPLFEQPITISQISFDAKEPVYQHMLMIGDTAGLIHPLCGNGMAMAIHSAKICAELLLNYLKNPVPSRELLETNYTLAWNRQFKSRLRMGRLLSQIIRKENLFKPLLSLLVKYPSALPLIIKRTHGKPF
ncbi:NAD(P)/FAD-dependent oxidoreductase [Pedobacter sp. MC2016-24]|uniref:NAD(P)/FAD-dependent oxidoreductase n=1 Tax=Pedobacter sp. MC2016-24 TaxID=2780090 RepID=UPI0018824723|nr:NAD(P)/FAD-dependent oxidoreductase [Pedobacter sp. MC2016-24]MBE9600147.1 NAD(P)/FAD-dependent oxidoreductase [Pedobacter sp. MC2016-24]